MNRLLAKFRALFRKEKLDRDMAEEMRFHLAQRAADNVDDGMRPDEARHAAQRKFGNVGLLQERAREQRGWLWLEQAVQDLRHATRALRKNPGFTTVAVLTLALGIGANTAMFSVCNAVLLRPLPLPDPERIVFFDPGNVADFAGGDYTDLRASRSFSHFAAYMVGTIMFSGAGEPERLEGAQISSDFLPTLGVAPWRGRNIRPEEDREGGDKVALIAHTLWQRKFAGAEGAIGQTVKLNGQSHTIVGVLPPGVDFPPGREVFVPLALRAALTQDYGGYFLKLIARLQPGVTRTEALAEVAARLRRDVGGASWRKQWSMRLMGLQEARVGDARTTLLVLMGAVALVILIACSNLANLLLASATQRHREIALRLSLGASRARVVRQFLTESLLLSLLGAVAGVLLASASLSLIRAGLPASIPRIGEIALDGRVLAFTAMVALLAGVGFGTLPAWRAAQTTLTDALKSGGRGTMGQAGQQRVRALLVVGQVALTIVLLTAAALFLKSFVRLQGEPIGFRPERLLTARSALPGERYAANPARVAFVHRLLEETRRQPGLQDVAVVSRLPFSSGNETYRVSEEGAPETTLNGVAFRACTPKYFRGLGITLMQGREFTEADNERAPRVVVINDVLAKKLWPGKDPIGRRIQETSNDRGWREIVGVVSSVRHRSRAIAPAAEMFVPWSQTPGRQLNLVVRTPGEPEVFAGALRRAFAAIDPELALYEVHTMEERLSDSVAQPRFRTALLGAFAAIALAMAVVGLYGTMAYSVSQRTQELGVRMALGAQPADVLAMVLAQGIKLTIVGVACGLAAALALTRVIERMLHGITPTDPVTLATVSLVLLATAAIACWVPARRAAKVDPMVALRSE